jgi:hypothetical protein
MVLWSYCERTASWCSFKTQGSVMTADRSKRFYGSLVSKPFIKFFTYFDKPYQTPPSKLKAWFFILKKVYSWSFPEKGGAPVSRR